MNSKPLNKLKQNYIAWAFLLPVAALLILRLISTIAFNGRYSMLYSDCYHQYYPFFLAFRKTLLSGESLLYSWQIGMGVDYLGLISYYLASPLNLLSVLVPESLTLAYFSMLMPLKLGLASMFFAIFLKRTFRKDGHALAIFGSLYGLCAWAIGFQWNIMWLDTFALLPLVVLGTISLLRDKKFLLYTVSLFFSVFSNYYIGFFTCIFTLLVFICYEICCCRSIKQFCSDFLRIGIFTVLAIGMTAVLELPALAALQTTHSSVNKFPDTFRLNIVSEHTLLGLLDAMRQVAGNAGIALEPNYKEGLPNIFCGIGTNVLALLFLTCKQVKIREKLCTVFLLLFFNVSFIIRQLDYIWHGFHFTNMIPYRFSFLYSFVLLYMAYRAWLLRRSFQSWQLLVAGLLSLALMLCSKGMEPLLKLIVGETVLVAWSNWSGIWSNLQTLASALVFPVCNLAFIVIYPIVLARMQKVQPAPEEADKRQRTRWLKTNIRYRQAVSYMVLCIMAAELIIQLINFGCTFPGTNVSNYPKGTMDAEKAIELMENLEKDTLFYRAETTHTQTLNDGALNGYNGITTFTSSANVKVTEFMKALGYGAKNTYNRYAFESSSPVANLFLGLKYMIERDGAPASNSYFDQVYNSDDVYLLQNNAYLPLGFLADPQLINVDFSASGDRFEFQNRLLRAASGIPADVWHALRGSNLTIQSSGAELYSQSQTGYCSYTVGDSNATIVYSYTADREGFMCFHLDQSKKNKIAVYLNGAEKALYNETYSLPQMMSVCDVKPGDIVEIKLTCTKKEKGTINLSAAILDETQFRRCYDVLAAATLELTKFRSTFAEGTINCNRDGVLYTSIPQNGNWVATVDGEEAQIVLIGDAMIGLILSEGAHTISFRYENKAFSLGWKTSVCCFAIFMVIYWVVYKPKLIRRKGKYEQK